MKKFEEADWKYCNHCKCIYSCDFFYSDKSEPDNLNSVCKKCSSLQNIKYGEIPSVKKHRNKKSKEWREKNKVKHDKYLRDYNKKYGSSIRWCKKQQLLFLYSDGNMVCELCGIGDTDLLDIDHIDNTGGKERKDKSFKIITFLIKKINNNEELPNDLRVLCRNCNWKEYLKHKDKKRVG